MDQYIAFAFNAKSFGVAILGFLYFCRPCPVFWTECQKFLRNVLRLVIKQACDQDLAHSLNTSKNSSVNIILQVTIRYKCGT